MESQNKVISTLKFFGLTKYQSVVYISIINSLQITAQDIIDQTDIPRSKVYEALDYLVENDWVKKINGRPMIYEANHYQNKFEKIKIDIQDQISKTEDILREMWR